MKTQSPCRVLLVSKRNDCFSNRHSEDNGNGDDTSPSLPLRRRWQLIIAAGHEKEKEVGWTCMYTSSPCLNSCSSSRPSLSLFPSPLSLSHLFLPPPPSLSLSLFFLHFSLFALWNVSPDLSSPASRLVTASEANRFTKMMSKQLQKVKSCGHVSSCYSSVDGVSNFFDWKFLVAALGRSYPPPVALRQSRILAVKLNHMMLDAK